MRFCELFIAGSPAGTIVSAGSLGRAIMMLEDPKLVKIPRTSQARRFCILFLSVCHNMRKLDKSSA